MGWSKRQVCQEAYGELAVAGYTFDLTPAEMQTAVRRLDTMMATWAALGIQLGYAFGTSPDDTDLDQDCGLPLTAVECVYLNLAVRLGAGLGKLPAPATKTTAKSAYDAMIIAQAHAQKREIQLPNIVPIGAGAKALDRLAGPFVVPPDTSPLTVGSDGNLQFNGA